ncbi:MAG: hypothetical protein HFI72_05620 [Peptococcaceae bacterium]|nr:hypothetical protein [Peptococcaceae bacterium]
MVFVLAAPLVVRAASEGEEDPVVPDVPVVPYRYEVTLGNVAMLGTGGARTLNVYLIEPADAPLYSGSFGFQLPAGSNANITPHIASGSEPYYELAAIGLGGNVLSGTRDSGAEYYALGWTRSNVLPPVNGEEHRVHLLEILLQDTDGSAVADLSLADIQLLHFEDMIKEHSHYGNTVPDHDLMVAESIWRTATAEEMQVRPDRVGYYQGYFRHNVEVNIADLPVTIDDLPELVAKRLPAEFEGKLVVEEIDGEVCINGMPYHEFICPVEKEADGTYRIELQVQTDIDCDLASELEAGVITSYDPKKPVTIKWYLQGEDGTYPADVTGFIELPVWQGPQGGDTEEGGGETPGGGEDGGDSESGGGESGLADDAGDTTTGDDASSGTSWTELDVTGQKTFHGNSKGTWRYKQKGTFTVGEAGIYKVEILKPGHITAVYEGLSLASGECSVPDTFLIPGDITNEKETEVGGDDKTKLSDRTVLLGFINHSRKEPPAEEGNAVAEQKLAKYNYEKYCADIDGDGKIDMQDLNILMHKDYYNQVKEVVRQNN